MPSRLLVVVCSLFFAISAPCVYAQIVPVIPARPVIDDYHFMVVQLAIMTRLLALFNTIALCTAIALLAICLGSLVNLCLSERIRPERPHLNAIGNQSNRPALRISSWSFDWLRKARHIFHELKG